MDRHGLLASLTGLFPLGLTLTACTSNGAVTLSEQVQEEVFRAESLAEERHWMDKGIDSPLMLGGPYARRPARCLPTRQTDIFVCRTITMERETSLWRAQDMRFRRYGSAWGYDPARYDKIEGPYRLAAPDGPESTHICYDKRTDCLERIPGVVFTWGANKKYVVAARHPLRPGTGEIDKSQTEYFYIDNAKDDPSQLPSKSVHGPFSAEVYSAAALRLNLPPFKAYYPDLK
jgi:hypothetical protein